jgi:hypothetical protein
MKIEEEDVRHLLQIAEMVMDRAKPIPGATQDNRLAATHEVLLTSEDLAHVTAVVAKAKVERR